MKDLLNAGQVLGRSEMKKVLAGSGCQNLIKCCNSAGTCTSCVYAPGGATCGPNDTQENCCFTG